MVTLPAPIVVTPDPLIVTSPVIVWLTKAEPLYSSRSPAAGVAPIVKVLPCKSLTVVAPPLAMPTSPLTLTKAGVPPVPAWRICPAVPAAVLVWAEPL